MTPNDLPLPEAVRFYRAHGFRPIPMVGVHPDGRCRCGGTDCNAGKHEFRHLDGQWKEGREFHPIDFLPDMNVALALGAWGGGPDWLVCLDVDGPLDVSTFFAGLPVTLTQKSPRGMHYFFTVPPFTPLGNWVDVFLTKYGRGTGLDVRYARGKINAAPSRSAFGVYRWLDWRPPAALPESAISRILSERRHRGLPVQSRWERDGKRA